MKLRDGFMLKEVAGSYIVVPVGENLVDFSAMITVNETGAFLWELLQKGCEMDELVQRMTAEYDIAADIAKRDIESFLQILIDNQITEL